MTNTLVKVQREDFNFADEVAQLEADNVCDGATVTFVGRVRNHNDGQQVLGLHLEHYPGMTEKALQNIAVQARDKWSLGKVTIIHRYGDLALGEQIVFVGVTSKHRQSAYQANQFIMDYLKVAAPFWKKELTAQGERWLSAKQQDNDEAAKW
ncbi:molybdopterin synthase catalytic subunit MoaE [Thalassotalea maritima]|uniref:molybdopterin synthase catalytic subunit MoaE n=1 Tax=Thalassotalea maritima TaxID=3242416 RepID=UPI0035277EAB